MFKPKAIYFEKEILNYQLGKELMNNTLKNFGSKKETSKERLPTDSVAKKNLLTLYNQLKAKK